MLGRFELPEAEAMMFYDRSAMHIMFHSQSCHLPGKMSLLVAFGTQLNLSRVLNE